MTYKAPSSENSAFLPVCIIGMMPDFSKILMDCNPFSNLINSWYYSKILPTVIFVFENILDSFMMNPHL